jgi:acetolactate decarboxylase
MKKMKKLILGLLTIIIISCNSTKKESNSTEDYSDIKIVGAMKNVMWKGELGSSIELDTISNKKGLYGLGPVSYLAGELLINDGQSYISKVTSDSTMTVEKSFDISAPFFVYANVTEWNESELPTNIKSIQDLEKFIDKKTAGYKRPFVFKLKGEVSTAIIHSQNLPEGTKVSSPDEAHQGQVNYKLTEEEAEIIGFFSTEHKGVFTHHDSFLHMHLITKDKNKMGHLDELVIGNMKLYLPKK